MRSAWVALVLLLTYLLLVFLAFRFLDIMLRYQQGVLTTHTINPILLSVRQLKQLLEVRGVSYTGYVEKQELAHLVEASADVVRDEVEELGEVNLRERERLTSTPNPSHFTGAAHFYEQVEDTKDSVWLVQVIPMAKMDPLLDDYTWTIVRNMLAPFAIRTGIFNCRLDHRLCKSKGWSQPLLLLAMPRGIKPKDRVIMRTCQLTKPNAIFEWLREQLSLRVKKVEEYGELEKEWLQANNQNGTTMESNIGVKVLLLTHLLNPPLFLAALSIKFTECGRVALRAAQLCAERFPDRERHPDYRTILRVAHTFRESGSVVPNLKNWNFPRPVHSFDNELDVLLWIGENPSSSVRRISHELRISKSTVWRIIKSYDLRPYMTHIIQGLRPTDSIRRIEFITMIDVQLSEDAEFLMKILWTDESKFTKNGILNRSNFRVWAEENLRVTYETRHQIVLGINGRITFGIFTVKKEDVNKVGKIPSYLIITPDQTIVYGRRKMEHFNLRSMNSFLKAIQPEMNDCFLCSLLLANMFAAFYFLQVNGESWWRMLAAVLWTIIVCNLLLFAGWLVLYGALHWPVTSSFCNWCLSAIRMIALSEAGSLVRSDWLRLLKSWWLFVCSLFAFGVLARRKVPRSEHEGGTSWWEIDCLFRQQAPLMSAIGLDPETGVLIERLAVPALWLEPSLIHEYASLLPTHKYRAPPRRLVRRDSPEALQTIMDSEDDNIVMELSRRDLLFDSKEVTECAICLDKYRSGVLLCTLPCSHNYHHKCIFTWLSRNNHHCPICRWPAYKTKI